MFYRNAIRSVKHYRVNPIIKTLIISDFIMWSANNLVVPLFAVFITTELGAGVEVAGIASAIYLLSTALFEAPIAFMIDKTKGERDDLYTSVVGSIIMGMAYIMLMFIDTIFELYLIQCIIGFAFALSFPGWSALFTSHIDKKIKALEWSIDDTLLSLGMAVTAALGGFLVKLWGFDMLFLLVGTFQIIGGFLLLTIETAIKQK